MKSNTEKQIELFDKEFCGELWLGDIKEEETDDRKSLKEFLVTALQAEREEVIKEMQGVIGNNEQMIGYDDMDKNLRDFIDRTAFQRNKLRTEQRLRLSALGEKKK